VALKAPADTGLSLTLTARVPVPLAGAHHKRSFAAGSRAVNGPAVANVRYNLPEAGVLPSPATVSGTSLADRSCRHLFVVERGDRRRDDGAGENDSERPIPGVCAEQCSAEQYSAENDEPRPADA
jgi:hypothetical protein